MRFRNLKRLLGEYGIEWDESRGKGSHGTFCGLTLVSRTRQVFPIPRNQQVEIRNPYLSALRRAFELTEENGVSDKLFV